jgi:hypothetical protein
MTEVIKSCRACGRRWLQTDRTRFCTHCEIGAYKAIFSTDVNGASQRAPGTELDVSTHALRGHLR